MSLLNSKISLSPKLIINIPRSLKSRVMLVHFNYLFKNFEAVEDEVYKRKIDSVDSLVATEKPNLVVFPEGAYSDYLFNKAKCWNKKFNTVVVCGTKQNKNTKKIVSIVITNTGVLEFEKESLSPYDRVISSKSVVKGSIPGGDFYIDAKSDEGSVFKIKVGLLICYDFRFHHDRYKSFRDAQLIVVPMFDNTFQKAQEIAHQKVRYGALRILFSNKAFSSVEFTKPSIIPTRFKIGAFMEKLKALHGFLPKSLRSKFNFSSSILGPINKSDQKLLKDFFQKRTDTSKSIVWSSYKEKVVVGNIEVGVDHSPGSDYFTKAGYFYDNFVEINL